ncbi:hypothetical protein BKA00_005953 [Actinomadura coerulea]|uniref:Uncharacterized protein n=1 Tax=Actinomadura coerulea TaxID=46159 RepID=A0A7X0G406_9ACTN|nr:hypothetical protein [Actinomadura coerulea]MBB6399039.1 hypothetical protein [Actinomadura coerulea]GGQ22983.1 hypothetical protein GCM10010187_44160 [Actinomadura coerulea]
MLYTLIVVGLLAFVAARQNSKQLANRAAIIAVLMVLVVQVGSDGPLLRMGGALLVGVAAGKALDKVSPVFTPADPKSRMAGFARLMKSVAFIAFLVVAVIAILPLWE